MTHRALRLRLDSVALKSNWQWLQRTAGVPAGAAVKADGYGLGARDVTRLLAEAGCRDFFVSSWAEANELGPLPEGAELSVLHGVGPEDVAAALANRARPVLNSPEQVARWKEAAPGHPCDLMVDTGMNRLGLRTDEIQLLQLREAGEMCEAGVGQRHAAEMQLFQVAQIRERHNAFIGNSDLLRPELLKLGHAGQTLHAFVVDEAPCDV